MINRLQKKYALSVQGAKDLFKAIVYSVLANISLMLPVALLAIVLECKKKWQDLQDIQLLELSF